MSLPKPYYEEPGIVIYNADCRDIFPYLDPVDLVLTDPPWNLDYFENDSKNWDEYSVWLKEIRDLCLAKAKIVWIFQSTKAVGHVAHLFKDWGCFASVKNFCRMIPNRIPNSWDIAFYNCHKMTDEPNNPVNRNWHRGNNANIANTGQGHPTSRPLDTFIYILQLYKPGHVLDPFMGSGTTLRAAKELGRKAIGIEIEKKYCDIAIKRLQQEVFDFK